MRKRRRLVGGSYVQNDRRGLLHLDHTAWARRVLIQAITVHLPKFFEALKADVFPRYQELRRIHERDNRRPYWCLGWELNTWLEASESRRPEAERLMPVLEQWASRFHAARETWIIEGALETLDYWANHENALEFPIPIDRFCRPGARLAVSLPRRMTVDDLMGRKRSLLLKVETEFQPGNERFSVFRQRAKSLLEKELDRVETETRSGRESAGRSSGEYEPVHFQWFIAHVLEATPLPTIRTAAQLRAERVGDSSTIRKGVNVVEKLVGWHSPSRRRGRPPKVGK